MAPTTDSPTTTTTAALPTIAPGSLETLDVNLAQFSNGTIRIAAFDLTSVGTVTTETDTTINAQVLVLTGKNAVRLETPKDSCLTKISTCTFGVTFKFKVKLTELKENTYIFSSGAENKDTDGVALVYQFGKMHWTVAVGTKVWYATTERLVVNKYTSFKLSWHMETGVSVYQENRLIVRVRRFVTRTVTTAVTKSALFIGQMSTVSIRYEGAVMKVAEIGVDYASQDVLTASGLVTTGELNG